MQANETNQILETKINNYKNNINVKTVIQIKNNYYYDIYYKSTYENINDYFVNFCYNEKDAYKFRNNDEILRIKENNKKKRQIMNDIKHKLYEFNKYNNINIIDLLESFKKFINNVYHMDNESFINFINLF